MPMRLIVRTAALVVTSGIAVTALLAGPHGGIPAWGTGLVLSVVLLAVAAGAALDVAEWKDAHRGDASGRESIGAGAHHARVAVSPSGRTAGAATVPARQSAWAADTPLWPLRVCFTLQHATSRDVLTQAFSHVGVEPRGAMSQDALDGWLERYSGFGEWPIKRPVEMTVEIDIHEPASGRSRGVVRFQRLFSDPPAEIRSVSRVDDRLFQDNDVSGWVVSNASGSSWSVADLEQATVRVKAVYLSFDDEDFQRPPRFETLHLCFGEPARGMLSFTAAQLAAPTIGLDPAPLMRGPFFKTLFIEYELSAPHTALAEQLVEVKGQYPRT